MEEDSNLNQVSESSETNQSGIDSEKEVPKETSSSLLLKHRTKGERIDIINKSMLRMIRRFYHHLLKEHSEHLFRRRFTKTHSGDIISELRSL